MAQVTTYTGSASSTRSAALDRHLLEVPETTCIIVPTQRAAQQRMRQLLAAHPEGKGFLGRPVMTFQDFAAGLLEGSDDHFPLVSPTTQHLLLKRSIQLAQDGSMLDFLGEAVDRPGFIHHIQRVIAQLKQSAIDPVQFREAITRRAHPSSFDTVVAEIYANYQNLLLASKTFDVQGMYWLADMHCQHKKPGGLSPIDTLLIDGFDDFTPSEFRLIQSLEPHLERLIFGLHYDSAPERRDAYALVHATHEHIQGSFDTAVKDFEERTVPSTTQCQQVARQLFGRTASVEPIAPSTAGANLTLLPCHTMTHEIESIARAIKHQVIHDAVSLRDILIVFNQPEAYAHTAAQVFEEAGIPLQPIRTTTLAQCSVADFLLKLYESTAQWERESMLHLLTSPFFQRVAQAPSERVETYRHLAYRAEVIEGATQWKKHLNAFSERLIKREDREVEGWLRQMPHLPDACVSLIRDVERLAALTEDVPKQATFSEHIAAFSHLRESFVCAELLETLAPDTQEREFHAWDALSALLNTLEPTAETMPVTLSRAEFVMQLHELYALTSVQESRDTHGVLCLGAEEARHITMPYVYVCGVNEGVLPAPLPLNAIYTQFDHYELGKVGLHMLSPQEHAQKERLQFLRLFSIPTQHLTLSWHNCTQQGQALNKSPFVQDVLDLGVDSSDVMDSLMNLREAVGASLLGAKASSPTLALHVERVRHRVEAEKTRYARSAFNAYDGVLSSDSMIETVAGHYNTQHLFSAYQIETYIDCPFRFMMRSMLKISERETPTLAFDRRQVGIIYHHALEEFYSQYAGQLLEEISLDEARETMAQVATKVFEKVTGAFALAYPGIAQVERTRIARKLDQHVENHHEEGSDGWRPSHAEVTFGEALRSGSDPLSKAAPFFLEGEHESYRFTGRIDRVDLNEQGQARIVDYKSSLGSIKAKDIKDGRNIQSSLYAMALESVLMADAVCSESIYLQVGNEKSLGQFKKGTADIRDTARDAMGAAIHGIQAGIFHPKAHEKSCAYCPNHKACRFEEGRIAGKIAR